MSIDVGGEIHSRVYGRYLIWLSLRFLYTQGMVLNPDTREQSNFWVSPYKPIQRFKTCVLKSVDVDFMDRCIVSDFL